MALLESAIAECVRLTKTRDILFSGAVMKAASRAESRERGGQFEDQFEELDPEGLASSYAARTIAMGSKGAFPFTDADRADRAEKWGQEDYTESEESEEEEEGLPPRAPRAGGGQRQRQGQEQAQVQRQRQESSKSPKLGLNRRAGELELADSDSDSSDDENGIHGSSINPTVRLIPSSLALNNNNPSASLMTMTLTRTLTRDKELTLSRSQLTKRRDELDKVLALTATKLVTSSDHLLHACSIACFDQTVASFLLNKVLYEEDEEAGGGVEVRQV